MGELLLTNCTHNDHNDALCFSFLLSTLTFGNCIIFIIYILLWYALIESAFILIIFILLLLLLLSSFSFSNFNISTTIFFISQLVPKTTFTFLVFHLIFIIGLCYFSALFIYKKKKNVDSLNFTVVDSNSTGGKSQRTAT